MKDKVHGWFNSPERVAKLVFRAEHWRGTPFCANSNTPGPKGGVSCQMLAYNIYRECGLAVEEPPAVNMGHGKFSQRSLLEQWLEARPECFARLPKLVSGYSPFCVEAGDLATFRIGRVDHHMGIILPGRKFVHALEGPGVIFSSIEDATYLSRIVSAWRPVNGKLQAPSSKLLGGHCVE